MRIIQSRRQNIFNRFYLLFAQYWWTFIALVIITTFSEQNFDVEVQLKVMFCGVIAVIAFTLWLMIFNSGKGSLLEYGLEADEKGVHLIRYGDRCTILWRDFGGYIVKNSFPRMITLQNNNDQNIEFSYYTFSQQQRNKMFDYLENK